jgi:hypothetical protein
MTILEPQTNENKQKAVTLSIYKPEDKVKWDNFVDSSKNGVFLFNRDYMDYHQDRFIDHSLMFHSNDQLIAILPANEKDGVLCSHGGLTFGGVVSCYDMSSRLMLDIFGKIKEHCVLNGFSKIVYKTIPHIYHSIPSE